MTLLTLIREITESKKAAGIVPAYTLVFKDLISSMPFAREWIEKELKELEELEIISIGRTINDRYIRL